MCVCVCVCGFNIFCMFMVVVVVVLVAIVGSWRYWCLLCVDMDVVLSRFREVDGFPGLKEGSTLFSKTSYLGSRSDYQKEWADERGPDFGNFRKTSASQNIVELDL